MNVLVTGADGFIGSHLTEALLAKGYRVKALSQYNSFNYWGWLEDIPSNKNLEIVSGDVRDPHFCKEITKNVDLIFHLAALIAIPYSYAAPDTYVDTNIKGTLNICQAAKENGNIRVIHTSTSEVYGTALYVPIDENHPKQAQSPYSASKIGADAMAMMLAGVERDDEVITQALTFIATCNAISYIGAHPVFIDVDRDTMGLSPQALESWLEENVEMREITKQGNQSSEASSPSPLEGPEVSGEGGLGAFNINTGKRIKACIPMHTFGHPVHLDELVEICAKYHIELVEDAAESLGSFYKGKHTGTFGKVGVVSFNGNKTITTGGGGMLLFNDEKLAEFAKHLTTQAKVPHRWEFVHDHIGYNYRMPNINAALGCAQMENLNGFLKNKREIAAKYEAFFSSDPNIEFFREPKDCQSNYWLNVILLKDKQAQQEFLSYTNDHGVMTRPVWKLMNHLSMFSNAQCGDLSNSEWIADRLVNIPSSVIN